jgi:hypothetical protein
MMVFKRAVVLCAVLMLHGAVITFFVDLVHTAVPRKKVENLQIVFITAPEHLPTELVQTLSEVELPAAPEHRPIELVQTLSEVEFPAAPEHRPIELVQTLSEVEFPAAPEHRPIELVQTLSEVELREVSSQREDPAHELTALSSDPSRFSLRYHLAAKDGMMVRHGESTLTFDGVADQYAADFGWTLGDDKGLIRSEGKLLSTLSPSVYMDTNESPKQMSGLVQDSVSMIWMLRQKLQRREEKSSPEDSQSSGNFSMLMGNEVTPYRWEILQTDELLLPGGAFDGVLLQSYSDVPGRPIFSIWFTPSPPYLPVRIRRTEFNGKVIDHLLKENFTELVKPT